MRLIFTVVLTVLGVTGSGCRCSPATPTSVTIRVKNASRDPIYLNDTDRRLGVQVMRTVGGTQYAFDEHPCECKTCDQACSNNCFTCADGGVSFIARLSAGESASRTWDGVVQVASYACGASCLSAENAPLDETFTAHLCYATQVTGFNSPDGGRVEAPFPNVGVTCVDKEFKPADGVVEVGPQRGSDCTISAECLGFDELCFDGSCTSGCPANNYPDSPGLQVASVTNRGFFTLSQSGPRSVASGTGTITSAQYNGTTLNIQVTRRGGSNEVLSGSVQVTMPTRDGPALPTNVPVIVTVTDGSTTANLNNRALVMRRADTNALLFVADVAQLGRVLTSSEISPFSIVDTTVPTGCRTDMCGKALFVAAQVGIGNAVKVAVESGETVTLKQGDATYRFVNAFNVSYSKTTCDFSQLRPYAFWLAQ